MATKTPEIIEPKLGKQVFLDCSAIVSGRVEIGDHTSIWPNTVLRGDLDRIVVGKYSNIQDLSLVHVDHDAPCLIGDYVTAGHQVCLHACEIGNESLIGMGSTILTGAKIEDQVMLGARSLVPEGRVLESGYLYFGAPVRQIRKLTQKEIVGIKKWAREYARLAKEHLSGRFGRLGLVT